MVIGMTYAIALIKGSPHERDTTHALFVDLQKSLKFYKETGVKIKDVFISFGWPDFVLLLEGENVELLKQAIVTIRSKAKKNGDKIETSTLICVKQDEIVKKSKKWAEEFSD